MESKEQKTSAVKRGESRIQKQYPVFAMKNKSHLILFALMVAAFFAVPFMVDAQVYSSNATITITVPPTNQIIMDGGSATFSVTATETIKTLNGPQTFPFGSDLFGPSQSSYQWQFQGVNFTNGVYISPNTNVLIFQVTGSQTNMLALSQVSGNAGVYQIQVTLIDPVFNGSNSATATLTIGSQLDLATTSLTWNNSQGGVDFTYSMTNGTLNSATTAKLFWASGTSTNDILSSTAIFTNNIPAGFNGQSATNHVPGPSLRNAPNGTTHLLLVVDHDNLVAEFNKNNNTIALADAQINFRPSANQAIVSDYTRSVLKDAMRFAGQAQAMIGSTARTTADQARVMYEQLEGPFDQKKMGKHGCTTTLCYSYQEYDSNGDQVVDVYVTSKAAGKSATQIKADMQQKIDDIKTVNPSAFKHTADPSKLQAIDVEPSSISNKNLFMQATSPTTDSRISRRLSPNTIPSDLAYHLEIPQPAIPLFFPPVQEAVVENTEKQPTGGGIHPLDLNPLSPSTLLTFTNRSALTLGAVSSGHQVFRFQASAGDVLSAGVDVVSYFPGSVTTNDDSVIFLFDSIGHLLVLNDDTDPFESEFESLIAGYSITNSGTYYIAVTTFGNNPVIGGDGTISGWEDDGGSNIQFNLLLSLIPSHLAIRNVASNLAAVEWAETGVLQESSNISTNWLDSPLATTPYIFDVTNQQRFYRLHKP